MTETLLDSEDYDPEDFQESESRLNEEVNDDENEYSEDGEPDGSLVYTSESQDFVEDGNDEGTLED